jgi:hypothetical protein
MTTGTGLGHDGVPHWGPAGHGRGGGDRCLPVLHMFVFICTIVIYRLYKFTLSDQAQVTPQLIQSFRFSVKTFSRAAPDAGGGGGGMKHFSTVARTHSRRPCVHKITVLSRLTEQAASLSTAVNTHCRLANQQHYIGMCSKATWLTQQWSVVLHRAFSVRVGNINWMGEHVVMLCLWNCLWTYIDINVGLRLLACWDWGFESRRWHGCLSVVCCAGRSLGDRPISSPGESCPVRMCPSVCVIMWHNKALHLHWVRRRGQSKRTTVSFATNTLLLHYTGKLFRWIIRVFCVFWQWHETNTFLWQVQMSCSTAGGIYSE